MKKVIFAILVSGMTINTVFAKSLNKESSTSVALGVCVPIMTEYSTKTYSTYKTDYSGRMVSLGVDLYGNHVWKNGFGLIGDVSIFFPLRYSFEKKGSGVYYDGNCSSGYIWNYFILFDISVAPMYYFLRTGTVFLGLGPQFGLSFGQADYYFNPFSSSKTLSSFGLGIGANLNIEWKFSKYMGISGGMKFMYWKQFNDQPVLSEASGTFEYTPYLCAVFFFPKKNESHAKHEKDITKSNIFDENL